MDYVNLIIDNNSVMTDTLYTYGSTVKGLKPGDKVIVPFGLGNKEYESYVHSVADGPDPKIKRYKKVISQDTIISLPTDAIEVSDWMRQRFFCKYIDAVKCFLPIGSAPKRRRKSYFDGKDIQAVPAPVLTDEQDRAVNEIAPYIGNNRHKVFLIHGVTSSGKTEVYIRVIGECLKKGKTAIMLVPEISLTGQTIRRFQERFGSEQLAVLHSRLSKGERYDQWMRIKKNEAKVVIGARSAVFAPLENIGAIILDEEHETTYKSDMSPKYDTVEVAIKRAEISGGIVLLGSATPSLTSSYMAERGVYKKVTLKTRYNKTPLPTVEIVDMREELKEGNKSIFSRLLYNQIYDSLNMGQQVILFLNRRGYSTFISCRSCGYVARCDECDISMTFHKAAKQAVCHFCGKRIEAPKICPDCGSKY
ncbi:MAG TPA: primosomal protein N', partial [Anaerovoracaceae bacterium]|nr:primosomal protein N' [Anaerovoracaceae bacterium]